MELMELIKREQKIQLRAVSPIESTPTLSKQSMHLANQRP